MASENILSQSLPHSVDLYFPAYATADYRRAKKRAMLVAAPIAICLLLPLVQIAGLFYLYDIFVLLAIVNIGLPGRRLLGGDRVIFSIRLLALAVFIGVVSALVRTGGEVRSLQYAAQYLMYLLFFEAVYRNIIVGRIDVQTLSRIVVYASLALAIVSLMLYFLLVTNQSVGEAVYKSYLQFAGFSERFFDKRYLNIIKHTGMVRAMGTWDVATTFGGMMALSMSWILIWRAPIRIKYLVFTVGAMAFLASGSRHSWVVGAILLLALMPGSIARKSIVAAGYIAILALFLVLQAGDGGSTSGGTMSFTDQVLSRVERTQEQGIDDSSLQLRYVEGPIRFLKYASIDPYMLIFGYGIGTEKSLIDAVGPAVFAHMTQVNYQFGFVSNGWLLIWRNMGIVAFIGLVGLFSGIWRLNRRATALPLIMVGLIIASDNYSVHVARCFFLILAFLSVVAGTYFYSSKINL